jgi:hypothetical protein
MKTISVTQVINNFKKFDREFWLSYKALEAVMPPVVFDECKMKLLKSKRIDQSILSLVNVEEFELKKLEIDAEWKAENEEAKATGTAIHTLIQEKLTGNIDSVCSDFGISGELSQ